MVQNLTITEDEADLRLDRWFRRHFPGIQQGRLEKLLRTGQIRVDGKRVKAGLRLAPGQVVRIPPGIDAQEPRRDERPPVRDADAQFVQSLVIHRDEDVIAINKPPGLAVQGGTGTPRHLDGMLDALRFEAEERPRLVHRLDRDTSGVMLLARNARAAARLGEAFRGKSTRKIYWAVVAGVPKPAQGKIDMALAKEAGPAGERMAADDEGKRAITLYTTIERIGDQAAWLALMPLTGRTHQLRVHCAEALGTPVLGDLKYGRDAAKLPGDAIAQKLHLHARTLAVPRSDGTMLEISASLPDHMRATWAFFGFDPDAEIDPFPPT
jgi:23S rRNA pseudouridine955/2504/2580 synthase